MNEQPGNNVEFFHPAAEEISQRIQSLLFPPQDIETQEILRDFLHDPEDHEMECLADPKDDSTESLIITMIKDRRSSVATILPETFKFPAFRINRSILRGATFLNRFGPVPYVVLDAKGDYMETRNCYYLNLEGQAIREETIKTLLEKSTINNNPELKEYFEHPLEGETGNQRVNFTISEGDSRLAPLAPGDTEYLVDLLNRVENGDFKELEFY